MNSHITPELVKTHTALCDNSLRIARMTPFPGGTGIAEMLANLDDDQIPTEIGKLLAMLPEEYKDALYDGDGVEASEAIEELIEIGFNTNTFGWFGEVHTPVVTKSPNGKYTWFSWSYHHVGYLFAPTAEAFLEAAAAWAEEREAEDRAEKADA